MGLRYTQVGLIALVTTITSSLFQPLMGPLSDRFRAEYVAAVSVLWLATVMALIGYAGSYLLLLGLVILASIGSATYHPAGAVIATRSSGTRRGASMALFSVGGNIGAALSPLWMGLAVSWFALRGTLTIVPVAAICAALLVWQGRQATDTAAQSGTRVAQAGGRQYLVGLVLITAAMMARSWFQVSLMTYLPTWVETTGGAVAEGGRLLAIFMFAVGMGSLLGGFVADRVGNWTVVVVSLALVGPLYWLFLSLPPLSFTQALTLAAVGVAIGCTFPTSILMAQDAWPKRVGLASGLVMGVGWAPGGLGASVTGFLADQQSLDVALQWLVVAPFVATLAVVGYRLFQRTRAL
jgi:FSR family fosmidomycin resistance protein-like MFS transporter